MQDDINTLLRYTERNTSADPKRAAQNVLSSISRNAKSLNLKAWEIAECLGKPHDTLSADGVYYKVQQFILHYMGTIGGTLMSVFGIAASAWAIKNASSKIVTALRNNVSMLGAIFSPGEAALTGIMKFFGLSGAQSDGEPVISPDALLMATTAMLPMPVSLVTNSFLNALGDTPFSPAPGFLPAPTHSSAAAPVASAPAAQAPTAAPKQTAAAGPSTASEAAQYTAAAASTISAVTSIISALGDGETRDGETRDEEDVNQAIVAAALSFGLDPVQLQERAARIAVLSPGEDEHDADFASIQRQASTSLTDEGY